MIIIAHRGNNKEALENSRDAYERAIKCGAQRIELDVQLTRDGHAVINHDDHLIHTTGQNLYCSQLDRKDLAKVKLTNDEPLPFLDEIVDLCLPRIELNIEIKGNNPDLAQSTAKVLRGSRLRDKIIISCFQPQPLLYMRDHEPDLKRACLVGEDELPWPYFSHFAPLNFMHMVEAKIIHPRMDMIGPNFMDQARHYGWQVYTWSPMIGEDHQRESKWIYLRTMGVDGHCTNYSSEMKIWLHEIAEHEKRVQQIGMQK